MLVQIRLVVSKLTCPTVPHIHLIRVYFPAHTHCVQTFVWLRLSSSLPLAEASPPPPPASTHQCPFKGLSSRCQPIVMLLASYKPICHALLMFKGYCCVCCLERLHHRELSDVIWRQDYGCIGFGGIRFILGGGWELSFCTHAWFDSNCWRNESIRHCKWKSH